MKIGIDALTILIWFKVITSIIGLSMHRNRKSKEIFFYMNSGLGEWQLMFFSLIADLVIWSIGIFLLLKL